MKANLNKMVERIEVFKAAWLENAPDAVFAGMTLVEFTEAAKVPGDLQGEIRMLVQQASRKRVDSLVAIAQGSELLDLVALGSVADVVPLDANNRILVHQGLARIRVGRAVCGFSTATSGPDTETSPANPPAATDPDPPWRADLAPRGSRPTQRPRGNDLGQAPQARVSPTDRTPTGKPNRGRRTDGVPDQRRRGSGRSGARRHPGLSLPAKPPAQRSRRRR